MNEIIAFVNTIITIIGFIFLNKSYDRGVDLFKQARKEGTKKILHYDIDTYEKIFLVKLGTRVAAGFVVMIMNLGRIVKGSFYLGSIDMYSWLALSVVILIMGIAEYWGILPYHQNKS